MFRILLTMTLAIMLAGSAAAQSEKIYRWVDEEGVTHYSSEPPADVDAEEVNIKTRATKRVQAQPQPEGEPDKDKAESEQPSQEEVRQRQREYREEVAEQCEQMRSQLQTLQDNPRLLVQPEDGEPYRMTEEERQGNIDELQTAIAERCED